MNTQTLLKDTIAAELEGLPEREEDDKEWRPMGGSLPAPVGAVVVEEDTVSVQAGDDLYSDLRILFPDDDCKPVIEDAWIIGQASHPHSDKLLLAIKVRRGERIVRGLFPIATDRKPVVDGDGAFELINEFFTKDEVRVALQRTALRLGEWKEEPEEEVGSKE